MLRLDKILLLIGFMILVVSCHNKITCPAYQSKFILDEYEFKNQFSLFDADSTPKEKLGKVKKSKYGIIVQKPFKKKLNEMKTIAMETVYPETSDSLLIAWVIPDSLSTDSIGAGRMYHSPYLTLFNNDQALYDAMYGHLLQAPRSAKEEIQEDMKIEEPEIQPVEEKKEKKFRLFKKKNRNEEEPVEGENNNE